MIQINKSVLQQENLVNLELKKDFRQVRNSGVWISDTYCNALIFFDNKCELFKNLRAVSIFYEDKFLQFILNHGSNKNVHIFHY